MTASEPRLPDFVIIGAPKSGTTALARWLGAHPACFVPPPKELRFLDRNWDRGLAWYAAELAPPAGERVVGEATPAYLAHPQAAARAAAVLPDTTFIALLRNPVDRLWSHYWFAQTYQPGRWKAADLEDALRKEHEDGLPLNGLLTHGMYAHHLDRWVSEVGQDRLLVLTFDDLQSDPAGTFARACDVVGLPTDTVPAAVGATINAAHRFRSRRLRRWMMKHRVWRRAPRLALAMQRLNQPRQPYPTLDPDLRTRLSRWYEDDVARLEQWLPTIPPGWTSD